MKFGLFGGFGVFAVPYEYYVLAIKNTMEANDNAPKSKPTSIISINPTKMEFQGFKVGRLYTELLTITNEW